MKVCVRAAACAPGLVIGLAALASTWAAIAAPRPAPARPRASTAAAAGTTGVDFDRDVLPILSEKCFACHGFDGNKRQAGLRFDTATGPFSPLPSGNRAIVRGNARASMLVLRTGTRTMPPPASGKKLTDAQILILRRWVEQGADYRPHWAFVRPERPPLPKLKQAAFAASWARSPIDLFVLARLEREGLRPAPEADQPTLIRRVTLDLTGLPPTTAEVDAFLADHAPGAYERVVDRLLASPHYGERMALKWLDLARYADTHGFHIDSHRDMWRWRDWVIDAYNRNLPFDQFTVEQLAGDLIPGATLEQKIATGFNRNHPINFEGGAIPEEYAAAYVFDRIDTTATTWMALTMRCGQCHDHKYEPITQNDYYRFFAFFNNVPEKGLDGQKGNAAPFIKAPLPGQQEELAGLARRVAEAERSLAARAAALGPAQAEWEKTSLAAPEPPALAAGLVAAFRLDETSGDQVAAGRPDRPAAQVRGKADWAPGKIGGAIRLDGSSYVEVGSEPSFDASDRFSYGAWVNPAGSEAMTVLSRMDDAAGFRGWDLYLSGGKVFAHLINQWESSAIRVNTKAPIEANRWTHLFVTYDGSAQAKGVRVYVNGQPAALDLTHNSLKGTLRTSVPVLIGRRNPAAPFRGLLDDVRIYGRELAAAEVAQLAGQEAIRATLALPAGQRTPEQREAVAAFYRDNFDEPYRRLAAELAGWKKKHADLDASIPTTMVMEEMEKPRDTFVLLRGEYNRHGEKVTPGTPAVLPPMPGEGPDNRLRLARWLVDPGHPLTARVAVNRYWEMYFGIGLVRSTENFGYQGERPSHPELLDWLAVEFTQGPAGQAPGGGPGRPWDVKALQRLIVTSATYRQGSAASPGLIQRDPENRLLARGPRFRLAGEFIRDQALAVGGLLVGKIGGPSVRPYQPPGLWEELAFGGEFTAQRYEQDHGENLYRRSMYTFWKRTCPPPSLQTFDAPEREFCIVRRSVTNTPLQALVLMNDPTYVEASRKFAERILKEGGGSDVERAAFAFRSVLARHPKTSELSVLLGILDRQRAAFNNDSAAAGRLLAVGESPRDPGLDPAEVAAWACVASVILNLDEAMSKG